jgi:hypothetical protein
LVKLFSYLFMISIFLSAISAFFVVIVLVRHFFASVSETETSLAYNSLKVFVICIILAPIFLSISQKLEKDRSKRIEY